MATINECFPSASEILINANAHFQPFPNSLRKKKNQYYSCVAQTVKYVGLLKKVLKEDFKMTICSYFINFGSIYSTE